MERNIPVLREKKSRSKGSKRLLAVLFLFFIILFIVLFFHSSLSKITIIEISGTSFTKEEDIVQAAELAEGDQFLAVQPARLEERIKKLEAVAEVEVRKIFPGKVEILVEEHPHVANELRPDGQWTAILANGQAIESLPVLNDPAYLDKPILSGWQGEPELKSQLTAALAVLPQELLLDVSEILPNPSFGYADRILLYTRSGYQVITSIEKLAEKLPYLPGVVHELKERGETKAQIMMLEAITSGPLGSVPGDGEEVDEESGQE